MLVFGKGYNGIKKKYIIPLSKHRVIYRSISSNSIKNEIGSGNNIGFRMNGNEYIFIYSEDILIIQLADSWKSYIRAILQYDAARKIDMMTPDICPNWDIVSDYYYAFYCACTILRFCLRGTTFIDSTTVKKINGIITEVMGCPTNLPNCNNFDYRLRKCDEGVNLYELVVKKSNGQTHETVWNSIKELLIEMREESPRDSDEYTTLSSLLKILNTLDATFPSKLRNEVNYQLKYGVLALEKKIYPSRACVGKKKNWLEPILSYDGKDQTLEKRIELFRSYTEYLHTLMLNLVYEYDSIQGSTGITKALNKHRTLQVDLPEGCYSYD